MDTEDTICAVASAAGAAARGIVRLSGPRLAECLHAAWPATDKQLAAKQAATSEAGMWSLPSWGPIPAQVLVWPGERSYTRQPTAEIHTLGSPPILQAMVRDLCERGARLAKPGEFTLRAFLAGRLDLAQAEAVLGVIDALDQRQLHVALTQLAGNLSQRLDAVRDRLLDLCADVEAGLDFADEHITLIEPEAIDRILLETADDLQVLLDQMNSRRRIEDQFRIVLQGRPNVGKSTLWNRLLQCDAALVSDIPGTTRDYLIGRLTLGDVECQIVDTAGMDEALDSYVDRHAQRLTQQQAEQADLVVLCLDATRSIDRWEQEVLRRSPGPDLVVLTKADLVRGDLVRGEIADERFASHATGAASVISLSATTGEGLDRLQDELRRLLVDRRNESTGVVSSTATRCLLHLQEGVAALKRAQSLAFDTDRQELLAAELRLALDEVGAMVGAVYTDDILDRVFSRFCIGK